MEIISCSKKCQATSFASDTARDEKTARGRGHVLTISDEKYQHVFSRPQWEQTQAIMYSYT